MNKIYAYIFFVLLLFVFIIFQSTVFSPVNLGKFYIDLTLIVVVYLSVASEFRGGIFFAFLSGYLIDLFSGANIGFYVVSRLSLFILLRLVITKIYSDRFDVHVLLILLSIIFEWVFLYISSSIILGISILVTPVFIIANVFVNLFAGVICFYIIKEIHGKFHT